MQLQRDRADASVPLGGVGQMGKLSARGEVVQPRLVVGLVLICAGVAWAAVRGLSFYGVGLADLGYDLDQPPLLLLLVGAWLLYRSRRPRSIR